MEYRKLQKTGGSSLTLTLPKKWIDLCKLKDKDKVKIYQQTSGILVIQPANMRQQTLRSTFSIDGLTKLMLARELIAHYISGTDEIAILSTQITPEARQQIRTLFQLLVGFEIIDESSTKLLVKNVFDATKFPIPQSIEKMFHITQSMVEDACEAVATHNNLLATDVNDRDFEVDKLYLAITRQLHILMNNRVSEEELGLNSGDLYYFEDIAVQLERIADHGVKIASMTMHNHNEKKSPLLLEEAAHETLTLLKKAEQMVKNQDNALAHALLDEYEKKELLTPTDEKVVSTQIIVENSLERIRGYIMNMAEMTIDQNVAQKIR